MKVRYPLRLVFVLLSCWLAISTQAQSPADLNRAGNLKFDIGDYKVAIGYYTQSLAQDKYNAGVYLTAARSITT